MVPRLVLLNSGIKDLNPVRSNKTVYPNQTVSCAKPKLSNQAQTVNQSFSIEQLGKSKNGCLKFILVSPQFSLLAQRSYMLA